MELGFGLPVCGAWATPNTLTVARQAEELGYASLWTIQRLIYAHEPRTEYYGAPGGPWSDYFHRVLDPIVAMSFVALATRLIRLGSAPVSSHCTEFGDRAPDASEIVQPFLRSNRAIKLCT